MTACTRSAVAMFTDFLASDDIEAAARRTGFVKRTSTMTGKRFLALITFGVWSEAKTTLAQWAAKVTQVEGHVDVSPEALHQRMHKRAIAVLQEMIQQALGKMQALAYVCEDHLFEHLLKVHRADSTGFSLPEKLNDSFPGSGGSATQAGAKIHLVWEYKQSLLEHFALRPWKLPDNKYVDTVVALARHGSLLLFDLGDFKIKALARIAAAGAYFFTRLKHQAHLFVEVHGHLAPFAVASFLKTMEGPLIEKQIAIGAIALGAARLIASRVPDQVVHERRRAAKKRAKKKGYTPSKPHLDLLAWNRFITNVPSAIWSSITVVKAYPIGWQIERIFKSWKSYGHLATINAKKADTVLWYLYGRMLLILINYALYPQVRCAVWVKKQRELSLLKLVRHFQAFADTWLHVLFQGELALRRFLQRACASAERLAAKAPRKRRTTAQTLRESLCQHPESVELGAVVNT